MHDKLVGDFFVGIVLMSGIFDTLPVLNPCKYKKEEALED